MRWLPVIFTIGTWYLSATSAMRRSSAGLRHAAADARNHREGAVLLDVGVHAIVDEARRAVLVVIAAPEHVEHVAERRLADLAADAVAVDRRAPPAPTSASGCAGSRAAAPAETARSRRAPSSFSSSNSGATAFSRSWHEPVQLPQPVLGARALLELRQRVDAAVVNGLDDRALGDADAAADRRAVGHLARRRARRRPAGGGNSRVAALRRRGRSRCAASPCSDGCRTCRRRGSRRRACRRERELLVDAERRILVAHRLGRLRSLPVAGGEDVDAHDLQLRRRNRAGVRRALRCR